MTIDEVLHKKRKKGVSAGMYIIDKEFFITRQYANLTEKEWLKAMDAEFEEEEDDDDVMLDKKRKKGRKRRYVYHQDNNMPITSYFRFSICEYFSSIVCGFDITVFTS